MMSKQLFLAAATLALASAQKFHGREEIECEKEHAVMGVGGRCHCGKGFKMQRLEPNALGEHQECVPTSMFNPAPQCPIGHECGREVRPPALLPLLPAVNRGRCRDALLTYTLVPSFSLSHTLSCTAVLRRHRQ
jgi:hypothetical protein